MSLNLDTLTTWSVLLVDDEPDNLEVVADSLGFFGMTVKTALNGQECLTLLQTWLPDLILLDLSMPVMDGWATLRHLKSDERTKALPILALSAHAIIGDATRALDAGFDGYMTKPVNVPTLIQDIRTALKNYKPRDAASPAQPVPAESVPGQPVEPVAQTAAPSVSGEPVTVQTPDDAAPAEPVAQPAPAEPVPVPGMDDTAPVEPVNIPEVQPEVRKESTL